MGGALALDAAWLFAAFLIILVLVAAGIAARRFLLERGGGTVECGLRRGNGSWRLGVASYQREELCWFGVFGFSVRPMEVFPRRDLAVVSRRLPSRDEAGALGPGMIVVECVLGGDGSLPETGAQTGSQRAGQTAGTASAGTSAGASPSGSATASASAATSGGAGSSGSAGSAQAAGASAGHAGAPGSSGPASSLSSAVSAGSATSAGSTTSAGPAGPTFSAGSPFSADSPSADSPSADGSPGTAASSGTAGTPGFGRASGTSSQPSIVELAMGESALTGFLAWLEAAPPGSHLGIALLPVALQ